MTGAIDGSGEGAVDVCFSLLKLMHKAHRVMPSVWPVYSSASMNSPIDIPTPDALLDLLKSRVDSDALGRRLAAEKNAGRPVAGRSSPFAYFERWMLRPWLLRAALRMTGLYERGRRNALALTVVGHDLVSDRVPPEFDGFRILQLSDLHIDMSAELENIVHERVAEVDFNLSVVTGDLRFNDYGDAQPALIGMARLRPLLGERALLVLGNHDSVRWLPYLESVGYEVLLNESTELVCGGAVLHVAGVDDRGYFAADDLRAATAKIPSGSPALLLSHSPEIIADDLLERVLFVLCGHTHGGQIRLPGGWMPVSNARCARRFCSGPWRQGSVQGYTARGVGASLLDVRFNCPPEITLHRLRVG